MCSLTYVCVSSNEQVQELNKLKEVVDEKPKEEETTGYTSEILEEILDLARNNQKLLRNPDNKLVDTIENISVKLQEQRNLIRHNSQPDFKRVSRNFHPIMIEELMMNMGSKSMSNHYGFLIALSFFKKDFPWIYDAGKELVDLLKTKISKSKKEEAVMEFRHLMDFTFEHPMMREMYGMRKEYRMYMKEFPHMLMRYIDRLEE